MRHSVLVLLSLCVAIVGCSKAEEGTEIKYGAYSLFDPTAANPSLCGGAAIPFPNNALFSGTTDATLNIPNPAGAPFVTAANLTDGWSTTASAFTDVLGRVDYSTAGDAILIFEADASPRFLQNGVDFTVQPSTAMAQFSGTGHTAGTCTGTQVALFLPISQQRSRILIEPLKPLNPSTTYIVAVTSALTSTDGVPATANDFFRVVNSDTKMCDLTGAEAGTEPDCAAAGAADIVAANLNAPFLQTLYLSAGGNTATGRLTTLETLRRSLVRPTVRGLKAGYSALNGGATLADSDIVIAWSFTTESTALTLSRLNTSAAAAAFQVANTTISTGDLGLGLADTADIWAGVIQVPYYLANSGGNVNSVAPLATSWTSAATLNAVNPPALGGAVPCGALAKSASTSICYPDPAANSTETIPVMVTVPNGNSGQVKPANGWPVVVFQHGITRNRTDVLAIAPALAAAGFVVVSIDQPLHGITNNSANLATNPFYGNQIFTNPAFGGVFNGLLTGERTFNLDLVDNTPAAQPAIPDPANLCPAANNQPDTVIDSSGTHFVNLSNLAVARDNLRQSEADLLHVIRSIAVLDLDQNSGALTATDIDETKIRFVGQSLGAIVGTTVMGIDSTLVGAASLNVPGGGLGKLLDASGAFGPRISAGLSCSFLYEGTDTYETFVRFAQHLIDPADPINYAVAANANHAIHLTMVQGDAVVPNAADSTCPPAADLPVGLGATAATVDALGTTVASGNAGAALIGQCPALVLPPDAPLAAITYQDEVAMTGFLSGTEALVSIMGITNTANMGGTPFASQPCETGDTFVQFLPDTAEHGTLLTPDASSVAGPDATFLAATTAMQTQTATFLVSNGALLPIGGTCP
jgi:pimeloyl-ACP methyl ester carboxylesterase